MSYTNENDALHILSSVAWGGTTIKGAKGIRQAKDIRRNIIKADGSLGPTARPVQDIDASAVVRFLDGNGIQSESSAAANLVATYKKANGGSATVTQNSMFASSWDIEAESPEGGFMWQQLYEVTGATITISISQ
ncbi:MAG: hypothetical protein ABIH03_05135 [Pseudomonadota bacterium]